MTLWVELKDAHILVAEDDPVSARVVEFALARRGCHVLVVPDGRRALEALRRDRFDALVTDWMMPELDGLQVIRTVRAELKPPPAIVMITILDEPQARATALSAGADEFIARPCAPAEVVHRVQSALARSRQPAPVRRRVSYDTLPALVAPPPFVAIGLAASTGGPDALITFARAIGAPARVVFFVTQHGPSWMMESLALRLQREAPALRVVIAQAGAFARPGDLVLAPGDHHLVLDAGLRLQLDDGPPENFVRPAADPMLRSLAARFTRHAIAVVFTGLGRDGALGAAEVARAGGAVFAQDPATSVAPVMPQTTLDLGVVKEIGTPATLAAAVAAEASARAASLRDLVTTAERAAYKPVA